MTSYICKVCGHKISSGEKAMKLSEHLSEHTRTIVVPSLALAQYWIVPQ